MIDSKLFSIWYTNTPDSITALGPQDRLNAPSGLFAFQKTIPLYFLYPGGQGFFLYLWLTGRLSAMHIMIQSFQLRILLCDEAEQYPHSLMGFLLFLSPSREVQGTSRFWGPLARINLFKITKCDMHKNKLWNLATAKKKKKSSKIRVPLWAWGPRQKACLPSLIARLPTQLFFFFKKKNISSGLFNVPSAPSFAACFPPPSFPSLSTPNNAVLWFCGSVDVEAAGLLDWHSVLG